jgi:hypothetical protein
MTMIRYTRSKLSSMTKAEVVGHALALQAELDRLTAATRVIPRLAGSTIVEPRLPGQPERWEAKKA